MFYNHFRMWCQCGCDWKLSAHTYLIYRNTYEYRTGKYTIDPWGYVLDKISLKEALNESSGLEETLPF